MRFAQITVRGLGIARFLGNASPGEERRARFARVVRYCRRRGARGAPSARASRLYARTFAGPV